MKYLVVYSLHLRKICAGNGYQWFSKPTGAEKGKTLARNIIFVKLPSSPELENILDPAHAFQKFFSDDILETIVEYFNQKIRFARLKYNKEAAIVSEINLEELIEK